MRGTVVKTGFELPANATASLAGFMVNANSHGKASFTATYGR